MLQAPTTFTGMIWLIKVICLSCLSGYCQYLLVFTDRTGSVFTVFTRSIYTQRLLRKYCHIFLNAQLTMFDILPPDFDKKAQNVDYLGLLPFS